MPRNKPRVQLALYARPKHPDSPHIALLIGRMKGDQAAIKHHAVDTFLVTAGEADHPWRYERVELPDITQEVRLLVRVVVAKVVLPIAAVDNILRAVPVYQHDDPDHERAQDFNCVAWVRAALERLEEAGAVSSMGPWADVHGEALDVVRNPCSKALTPPK